MAEAGELPTIAVEGAVYPRKVTTYAEFGQWVKAQPIADDFRLAVGEPTVLDLSLMPAEAYSEALGHAQAYVAWPTER